VGSDPICNAACNFGDALRLLPVRFPQDHMSDGSGVSECDLDCDRPSTVLVFDRKLALFDPIYLRFCSAMPLLDWRMLCVKQCRKPVSQCRIRRHPPSSNVLVTCLLPMRDSWLSKRSKRRSDDLLDKRLRR